MTLLFSLNTLHALCAKVKRASSFAVGCECMHMACLPLIMLLDSWQHAVTVFPLHVQKRSLGGWGKERNAKQFGYPRISELGDDNRVKELTPISKGSSAQHVTIFVG